MDISGTQFNDLSILSSCTNIRNLAIGNTGVRDISGLGNLLNLEQLYAENIELSDISTLSGLLNLNYLRLEYNQISDLTPLLTLHNNGDLQGGSFINIENNNMDITYGSQNYTIVNTLINNGILVEWESGNITPGM